MFLEGNLLIERTGLEALNSVVDISNENKNFENYFSEYKHKFVTLNYLNLSDEHEESRQLDFFEETKKWTRTNYK